MKLFIQHLSSSYDVLGIRATYGSRRCKMIRLQVSKHHPYPEGAHSLAESWG